MPRKTGHSRLQFGLFATPLEDMIAPDNPVGVVEAFVDSLDLDLAIIFTAYNLRRAMSILGVVALSEGFKERFLLFLGLGRSLERPVTGLRPVALWRVSGGLVQNRKRA